MNVPFLEAIENGGLVGDGAMGNLLYERGVFVNRNFDEINIFNPEHPLHTDYQKQLRNIWPYLGMKKNPIVEISTLNITK